MLGILHQSDLLTTLDIKLNINKAVSLVNHIHIYLLDYNQVKQFINNTVNKPAQVVTNLKDNMIVPNLMINFIDNKLYIKLIIILEFIYLLKLILINNILVLL